MEATYRNFTVYLAAGLALLVVAGFYETYFGLFPRYKGVPDVAHIHAAAWMAGLALLFVQPLLIHCKKFALHRMLGKASFILWSR